MKQKILVGFLSVEALACILFCILQTSFTRVFSAAMAFPFEQIGMGLRLLSLSSWFGNAVAFVVYFATSLSPAAALLVLGKKRKLYAEDGLLVALSAVLFAVLYIMINPGIIGALASGANGVSVGKPVLGAVVYSMLCGYLILRALRLFSIGGTGQLLGYMSSMLKLLSAVFVYLIFGSCFNELLDSLTALRAGNIGNEQFLGASYVFLALQFVVGVLPFVYNVLIAFAALGLLEEMRIEHYSAGTVAAAGRISRICAAALVATVIANISFNLLQLVFAKSLMVITTMVQIPVFSITFVLAALLFARLATENKQLKDDNDMFI
ncbi:MAG: hypothetical protein FWG10_01525 [Eubacteriaceae bacterium]|nr:hypothetical protein [Eubacteriaceae bacterium]